jgi:hypothetical protein
MDVNVFVGFKISVMDFLKSVRGIEYIKGLQMTIESDTVSTMVDQKTTFSFDLFPMERRLDYIQALVATNSDDAIQGFVTLGKPNRLICDWGPSAPAYVMLLGDSIYVCDCNILYNPQPDLEIDHIHHQYNPSECDMMFSYAQTWGYPSDACHRPFIYPVVV